MKLRNPTFRTLLTAGLMIGLMPVVSAANPVNERIEGFKESKRGIARIEDANAVRIAPLYCGPCLLDRPISNDTGHRSPAR